jgi:hypothetical protein
MIWIWGAVLARVRGIHRAALLYSAGRESPVQETSVSPTQAGAQPGKEEKRSEWIRQRWLVGQGNHPATLMKWMRVAILAASPVLSAPICE